MKHNYITKAFTFIGLLLAASTMQAQQLPDPSFEDWSGEKFDGNIQPKYWHVSNVEQLGFYFNLANQTAGRTGTYSLMVKCTEVGAMGITQEAPGYFSLGQPWQCLPGITEINKATAGTSGGINWTYRPDSIQVWIKRTGANVMQEDFHILYYAWSGTAKGSSYKGKNGSCTSYSATNEESDIRQALDKNECKTDQTANQIAEGWLRTRAEYNDWTQITVPIYYFNNDVPTMCNVIFSASNYPNFRANSGLYKDNALYVDDVKMLYSSKIQKLFIGTTEWKGFDPNSTEEQTYSLDKSAAIPDITAMRGAGTLSNTKGTSVTFSGRKLTDSEMSVQKGEIDGAPTIITVKAEDGSSTTTYKIKFISKPSNNARLANILVDGTSLQGYNSYVTNYPTVELPYGTTKAPTIEVVKGEEKQTVTITQASSVTGTATIQVTAPDGATKMTYTLTFAVKKLEDNTLKNILIDGEPLVGFTPTRTSYTVELPLGTTTLPKIEGVSAYPAGEQTIKYTAPSTIEGGTYQIAVTAPGNSLTRTYRLTFKITASTNTLLKDIAVAGHDIAFEPTRTTYYINLPFGTTALPQITYTAGDKWQTVTVTKGGIDGTTTIHVRAASGAEKTYKLIFSTPKSDNKDLKSLSVGGTLIEGFASTKYEYNYVLPMGTTTLPAITYEQGDAFQTVEVKTNGLEGTTRITVTAQDGSVSLYKINFSLEKADNATLKMITVNDTDLENFAPTTYDYDVSLPQGTTAAPKVSYTPNDEWQTVTVRQAADVNGEAKITVRAQTGAVQVYTIRFSVNKSSNTSLKMIYLDGKALADFSADQHEYTVTLEKGVSVIPTVTYDKGDETQRVLCLPEQTSVTLRVTAESGSNCTYVLNFIIQKSENAFLEMIYLDGDSLKGFDSKVLTGYEVEITDGKCPEITVQKAAGQQVTIFTPAGVGEATIRVQPEQGTANVYTIRFYQQASVNVRLQNIKVNGVALEGFSPTTYTYAVPYTGTIPTVTFDKGDERQKVTLLQEKETIALLVCDGDEEQAYTLHFTRAYATDATLLDIAQDGTTLAGFTPAQLDYNITLAAGEALPTITYTKSYAAQTVMAGWTSATDYQIHVTAESGAKQTYTIHFAPTKFADATLEDIQLDGVSLAGFHPTTATYQQAWTTGKALPRLTYTKRAGQNVLQTQVSDTKQQILVVAEDGTQQVYSIEYVVTPSADALLRDILIDGKSLADFKSDVHAYTYTLPWRTRIVPVINPVAAAEGQDITIYYSAVNQTTKIHVIAADKQATADYTIAFPVTKSANVELESVEFDGLDDFVFKADQTDYIVPLPYDAKAAPQITYIQAEPEQTIEFVDASINEPTTIKVIAENGDTRTYSFTFQRTHFTAPNRLKDIIVNGTVVSQDNLVEVDPHHLTLTVDLPYGTTLCNVACIPQSNEQTYTLQPGGTEHPTVITLYPNRGEEKPVVYTITPKIEAQNPAHLTSLSVNGKPVTGFDKNQLSYVISLDTYDENPLIEFTADENVIVSPLRINSKEWQAMVIAGVNRNIYTLHFHYPTYTVPNTEFKDWSSTKYNDAKKPTGWNVIADVVKSYLTYTSGKEVQQNGTDVVYMHTRYPSVLGLGGMAPGFITLGTIEPELGVAGSSNFPVKNDGIKFYNTPDVMRVRYMQPKLNTNNRIVYTLNGHTAIYNDTLVSNDYVEREIDLSSVNMGVREPNLLNIIINSYYTEKGGTSSSEAEMYLDWIRFTYSSKIQSIYIGNKMLSPTGTNFAYTFSNAEASTMPALEILGEAQDQAYNIVWGEEEKDATKATRKAAIKVIAEDGTSTDYTLSLSRPLSEADTLARLEVGGTNVWDPAKTAYTFELGAYDSIPSIVAHAVTNRQTVTLTREKDVVTITVTAEKGNKKTYTLTFTRPKSNDTTLKSLTAKGVDYQPDTREYEVIADTLPVISFEKQTDGQRVALRQGVLTVTAEDGTVGTYTIKNKPTTPIPSDGYLHSLLLDDAEIKDFNKTNFDYTHAAPTTTSFEREVQTDSVVQHITATGITWAIHTDATGTPKNTYSVTYPVTLSDSTDLVAILYNGELIQDFLATESDYPIVTDETVDLVAQTAHGQTTNPTFADNVFSLSVTAEDGTPRATPYTVTLKPDLSSIGTLQMIYLDGVALEGFAPDQLTYEVMLPCGNPKTSLPQLPTITYAKGQAEQVVEVTPAALGATTYINVTSEDGSETKQYELTIVSEPSHNAILDNILVNGTMVKGFEPTRYWYSIQTPTNVVKIQYSSLDHFQTVEETRGANGEYILTVTAEDGITKNSYNIEVWSETISNNAYLQEILLNGASFSAYDAKADDFTPKQLRYDIQMPLTATLLPDIAVTLQEEGQNWVLLQGTDVDTVRVTAPDGTTKNDYILNFLRVKSSNALLREVYIGGTKYEAFEPEKSNYTIHLPTGETTLPSMDVIQSDPKATYEVLSDGNRRWYVVTAENGTQQTYLFDFVVVLSEADTLRMIYENGDSLLTFEPHKLYYSTLLPAGQRTAPSIDWYEGDHWQTITLDTIIEPLRTTYQISVTAQSGKRNVYTLAYEVQQSAIDTLQTILLDNKELTGFAAHTNEYVITTSQQPEEVAWERGDIYQTVDSIRTADQIKLVVHAENGTQRTYTITFVEPLSNNADLKTIHYGSTAVADFDPEQTSYDISLPYGTTAIPAITFETGEEKQHATLAVSDWKATITVVAEDGTEKVYTLLFTVNKSDNAWLRSISLDGAFLPNFEAQTTEYDIVLPYGTTTLPTVTWQVGDEEQQVTATTQANITTITVISGNNENVIDYYIRFATEKSAINTLSDLALKGETVAEFDSLVTEYYVVFPAGTQESDLYTVEDITYTLADSTATAIVTATDIYTLTVVVSAANGDTKPYIIHQEILLPDNARLADLQINGVTIDGFDPTVLEYEFLLMEGGTMPTITATAEDSLAQVNIPPTGVGDTAYIYCQAQDGTVWTYSVYVHYTDLKVTDNATANDVILKHIPGSNQFLAATTRQGVQVLIFDSHGHRVDYQQVPICDPNSISITQDKNGNELLTDVDVNSAGAVLTIELYNTPFFYLFLQDDSEHIASGTMILTK